MYIHMCMHIMYTYCTCGHFTDTCTCVDPLAVPSSVIYITCACIHSLVNWNGSFWDIHVIYDHYFKTVVNSACMHSR